ncbi:MAG TPA: heme ABC exporter ATP-binding protein CcmA [Ktedonobacterales bacterium]
MPARALAVEVVKLTRAFGPKPVLRGVDLALEQGERLALFGANGAGKTTLLRVLATLARPDAGTARVGGLDVAREADAVRRIVGYVGHQPHIYEELTVRENLRFFARMYGVRDAAGRAEALIARMGLAARAGDRARTLSRGLLQRLALARGIVQEPDVLLLDEPETGLDAQAFGLLRDLVEERAVAGRTTIFTTHAAERGLELASVVAVLARGRITYAGPAAGLDAAALRTILDDSAGTGRGR